METSLDAFHHPLEARRQSVARFVPADLPQHDRMTVRKPSARNDKDGTSLVERVWYDHHQRSQKSSHTTCPFSLANCIYERGRVPSRINPCTAYPTSMPSKGSKVHSIYSTAIVRLVPLAGGLHEREGSIDAISPLIRMKSIG